MRTNTAVVRLVVLCLATGACSDSTTGLPDPTTRYESVRPMSLAPGRAQMDYDDLTEMAGRDVPGGFGGTYINDSGELVVRVLDTSQSAETRSYVSRQMAPRLGTHVPEARVQVRPAEYRFADLNRWHRALADVLGIEGSVFTDLDERRNRIVVGVRSAELEAEVRRVADSAGVPAAAVVVEEVKGQQAFQSIEDDGIRPVPGGVMIGPSFCTLGFNVTHWEFGRSFVTASHCPMSSWGVMDGVVAHQNLPNRRIGAEVLDPSYVAQSGCPSGRVCRYSDASLYQYDDTVTSTLEIARTVALGSKLIDPVNPRWDVALGAYCFWGDCTYTYMGTQVEKVGRATGWTSGIIDQTCASSNQEGSNKTVRCAMRATFPVAAGDSGAPVFAIGGFYPGQVKLVGVLFGGHGSFSWIEMIRMELGGDPSLPCHGFWHSSGWLWC